MLMNEYDISGYTIIASCSVLFGRLFVVSMMVVLYNLILSYQSLSLITGQWAMESLLVALSCVIMASSILIWNNILLAFF